MSKTVLETVIDRCQSAIYTGKPILVLRTNEIELISRLIESDKLVVRLSKDLSHGQDGVKIVPTQFLDGNHPLNLFQSRNKCKNDINIHYCREMQLNNFALDNPDNYGTPQLGKEFPLPNLYLIQYYGTDADPYSMWRSINLNAYIDRFLQEKITGGPIGSSLILVYGENAVIPACYKEYCEIIEEPYPEAWEIQNMLQRQKVFSEQTSCTAIPAIADALLGFSLFQVERLIRTFTNLPLQEGGGCILTDERAVKKEIQKRKEQILKKDGLLELIPVDNENNASDGYQSSQIGGMKIFKDWIAAQKQGIKEGDRMKREVGAMPPKGVLLCGIPGCGKSMAVQSVASELKVPLLKMDVGQLMGKYVGESEHNMNKALKIAEAMSPCVLFIDELDKGFGGAGKNEDSGPFRRMFGTLLGWMQDCKQPCFIFATANDISALPKEFFRSGRFDCLFSLFMPTEDECVDIFRKQMLRAEKQVEKSRKSGLFLKNCWEDYTLRTIIRSLTDDSRKKRFITGADIAKIVNMALRMIWNEGQAIHNGISEELWTASVLKVLDTTTVYGDSKENLDSIALCYIRLLRSNFISASADPLFAQEDYQVRKKPEDESKPMQSHPLYDVSIIHHEKKRKPYDSCLMETLTPLMEEYGVIIEENALRRMI